MKRTYIAAALLACAAAPAMAADYYYYYPSGTAAPAQVVTPAPAPAPQQIVVYQDQATTSVVQQRLQSAGYGVSVNGALDAPTIAALKDFQLRQGLAATGLIDQPTMAALGISTSMSGSVGGAPVIVSRATPVIIAPANRAPMPVNIEGTPGNNLGTSHGENYRDAHWASNY